MIRCSTHGLHEVMPHIKPITYHERKRRVRIGEHDVKLHSARLRLFKRDGVACVQCGVFGRYFAVEKHVPHEQPHVNLYGINADGEEVLMTKDHIHPHSKGGSNAPDNLQVMCATCNAEKSDKVLDTP